AALSQQQIEQLIDSDQLPLVVEPAEVLVVAEAALDLRRSEPGFERVVRGRAAKKIRSRIAARLARFNRWPAGNQSAQDRGFAPGHDLALEALAIHALIYRDWPHGLS